MRLIKVGNDGLRAAGWIALFLGSIVIASRFLSGFSTALSFLFVASLLYWPIRLVLESSVTMVRRLLRK